MPVFRVTMGKRRRHPSQPPPPPSQHQQPPPHRSSAAAAPLADRASSARSPFPNHFVDPSLSRLDLVDSSSTSPSSFFSRYIATRTPCLLTPPSPLWPCWRWSNEQLCMEAGDCVVQVEQRAAGESGFGHGNKVRMKFRQFVRRIAAGDSDLYITTQYYEGEKEAEETEATSSPLESLSSSAGAALPYLLAPPLTHLLGDFPLHPPLFGCLIPTQFNLWFGHAQRKTSSRLHHDFHCNLYVLLRGHKHITLVSPRHTHRLRLSGRVREVKRNGLICYDGDGMHEDASTDAERRQERKCQVEERIAALESELQLQHSGGGQHGKREELQAAEAELDELLDDILDDEGADGGESDEGGEWRYDSDEAESAEGSEEAGAGSNSAEDDLLVDAAEMAEWKQWSAQSRQRGSSRQAEKTKRKRAIEHASEASQPPNFSALSAATLPADVPRVVVHLRAPAMLYMPCGWFHEVESESEQVDAAAGEGEKGHCALNVWFMPPDQRDEQQPYSQQQLWEKRWQRQRKQLEELSARRAQWRQTTAFGASSDSASNHAKKCGGVFGRRGWRRTSLSIPPATPTRS